MGRNRLPIKRTIGLLLIILGIVLLLLGIPFVFRFGLFGTLMFSWFVALLFAVAGFLLADLGFWASVRAILIGFGLIVPSSLIMLIPLPEESQFLLWASSVSIILLFYRRYYQRHKPHKTPAVEGIIKQKKEPEQISITIFQPQNFRKPSAFKRVVGIMLVIASVFLLLVTIPALLLIGLLKMWLLTLVDMLVFIIGYCLSSNRGLKYAVQVCIVFAWVYFLPVVVLFPLLYEILSICIWGTASASLFYWFRRKSLTQPKKSSYELLP